jgi:hypothetical protein
MVVIFSPMTYCILTVVFFCANLLTEVFTAILNILAIALDILVIALVLPGGDVELDNRAKIYRVHFKDGTSKFVAAKSSRGLVGTSKLVVARSGRELAGLYAQRVSPKRG